MAEQLTHNTDTAIQPAAQVIEGVDTAELVARGEAEARQQLAALATHATEEPPITGRTRRAYEGHHRARRDQPSTFEQNTLNTGDLSVRSTLHEVRSEAYTHALHQAKAEGLSPQKAEVAARVAAQDAVTAFRDTASGYRGTHRYQPGGHRDGARGGSHRAESRLQKVAKWFTYSEQEWDAKQASRTTPKPPVPRATLTKDGVVPQVAHGQVWANRPNTAERTYNQQIGALDSGEFAPGRATVKTAETAPVPANHPETQLLNMINKGVRTPEEVLNELYGPRIVGGTTVEGGRITQVQSSHASNIGPVERKNAKLYADQLGIVSMLEGEVTDTFSPSSEVVEALLYPHAGGSLSEEQKAVVQAVSNNLRQLRTRYIRPGETLETRVRPDRVTPVVHRVTRTKDKVGEAIDNARRTAGVVALHGAVWAGAAATALGPRSMAEPRQAGQKPRHHTESLFAEQQEAIRIYSPGEVAHMAFARAHKLASGSFSRARDWFSPEDPVTSERRVSMLRIAGAAAALVTAAATSYIAYKTNVLAVSEVPAVTPMHPSEDLSGSIEHVDVGPAE